MKKLALKLESLRVESFETLAPAGGRGTVRGLESLQTRLDSECCVDLSLDPAVTCPNHSCLPQTQDTTPACCV